MPYIPLRLPPGTFRNGTLYQSRNRWHTADLVRWSEGVMQPIGGWAHTQTSDGDDLTVVNPPRGMLHWVSNANAVYLAVGTSTQAYSFAGGARTTITPASFTSGLVSATLTVGQYGTGNYGQSSYNGGDEAGATLTEANSWQLDNYGQYLIACAYSDGQILQWDLNTGNDLIAISGAPTDCVGVVVTPERMIVALGAGGEARKVDWCDQDDNTTWGASAAAGNTAGDFIFPGQGQIMCGRRMPNETLIFMDVDTYAMRYIGGNLIYSFKQVGANTGIISRQAVAVADGRAFWMGKRNFFMYDGFVKPIPCEISDAVFSDLNQTQRSKVAAWSVGEFTEIWFAYPSAGSKENNRIAVYNYRAGHFSGPWDLSRTCGTDAGSFTYPRMGDASMENGPYIYDHERGDQYVVPPDWSLSLFPVVAGGSLTPSAESGPIELGQGDQVMTVRQYIPDELSAGDVDATIYAAFYPTEDEISQDITVGSRSDVRLTGRQVRLKIEQEAADWRFGFPRLEVVQRGLR